ncbi:tubby-like F-box protein 5-like [Trifolium pratense]|uniref:Tubby-like F-box protein 5-like n=2 Tax=Trifolium pratense TaxID=57577 RepID=A0A2K3PIV6_TRIPR|nr:tubby-like F-box protein 5-like [Trifolium pratense]CAJ2635582.1 unnamed protein product [Trifolium pratense]
MSCGDESKICFCRSKSHLNWDNVDDVCHLNPHLRKNRTSTCTRGIRRWETLPPELLLDIIRRVEESETFWPARAAVVCCASVCKSWRSNFWGTKFTIYDTQLLQDAAVQPNCRSSERFNSKVSPRSVPYDHLVSTISYEWKTKTPRRVHCVMNSIPVSAIQEGGNAPTPKSLPRIFYEPFPMTDSYSTSDLSEQPGLSQGAVEPLILKNKPARWDDWCKSWCLDYMGRTIKSSGRNFQLVADVDPSHNVSLAEQERVILNFGKVGKDIFVMEYCYPLSAFQAFSICLTSFICNMYKSKCKA